MSIRKMFLAEAQRKKRRRDAEEYRFLIPFGLSLSKPFSSVSSLAKKTLRQAQGERVGRTSLRSLRNSAPLRETSFYLFTNCEAICLTLPSFLLTARSFGKATALPDNRPRQLVARICGS